MPKNIFFMSFLYVFMACAMFIAANVHSASIREEMAARSQAVRELKDRGMIGEDNKGYLEALGDDRQGEAMAKTENRDRSAVYAAIGRSQGVAVPLVGQRRAKMLADNGASGHWLQDQENVWYRK